jgi:hypothetical protein
VLLGPTQAGTRTAVDPWTAAKQAERRIDTAQREMHTLRAQLKAWRPGAGSDHIDPAFYREMLALQAELLAEWRGQKAAPTRRTANDAVALA